MSNLTELTAQIVAARAAKKDMSTEEFQQEMQIVYNFLKSIESGDASVTVPAAEEPKPQKINLKQFFKKDEVICLICNKSFTTLKRHLSISHDLKPGEYRKQFGIPSTQTLAAKSYVESRRQMAIDKGLGAGLVKFRADKKADAEAKNEKVPAVKAKAHVAKKKPVVTADVEADKSKAAIKVKKSAGTESASKTKK